MGYVKGWIYCALWYSSIIAGYSALFCPLFPILLVSNKLYRLLSDVILTFWQMYPTALVEFLWKCDVQVYGDPVDSNGTSFLIMNHRTRTDWNFLWPALYHATAGEKRLQYSTKFILKNAIKNIPGAGWVMQLASYVFIKRNWTLDKIKLNATLTYLHSLQNYKYSIIVFPEGTDFTPSTKETSDHFASKFHLQKYEHVLHPRTTGFTFMVNKMLSNSSLDALYDVTLVYPDAVPQTEKILFNGNIPNTVKLHFTRYPSSVLPRSETELKHFLEKRWFEKENVLKEFYKAGHFLHGQHLKKDHKFELYFALIFWTTLPVVVLYVLLFHIWFKYIVVLHTGFLLLVNSCFGGFQEFEIALFNAKSYICTKIGLKREPT